MNDGYRKSLLTLWCNDNFHTQLYSLCLRESPFQNFENKIKYLVLY